jgi:hypothetical protein
MQIPFWLTGSPLDIEMSHYLGKKFPHFQDRDVLSNTRSASVAKLCRSAYILEIYRHKTHRNETSVHDLELVWGRIYPPLWSKLVRIFTINMFVHVNDGGIDANVGPFWDPMPADQGTPLGYIPF